jgi:hypothetical protein
MDITLPKASATFVARKCTVSLKGTAAVWEAKHTIWTQLQLYDPGLYGLHCNDRRAMLGA